MDNTRRGNLLSTSVYEYVLTSGRMCLRKVELVSCETERLRVCESKIALSVVCCMSGLTYVFPHRQTATSFDLPCAKMEGKKVAKDPIYI